MARAIATALLLALALGPCRTAAQAADSAGTSKKVGVLDLFPFAYKGPDGKLTGKRGCTVSTCASRDLAIARSSRPHARQVASVLHSRAGAWQGEACSQTTRPAEAS